MKKLVDKWNIWWYHKQAFPRGNSKTKYHQKPENTSKKVLTTGKQCDKIAKLLRKQQFNTPGQVSKTFKKVLDKKP